MPVSKLAWITPRRVMVAAVLASVFASGWYLGQPVRLPQCDAPMKTVRYSDHLAADGIRNCDEKPRLLAWLTGNFR
ncbi:hypothetical protein ABZ622_39905 [Streptomyces sp. NPDC007164]|uniref:hypothetical protein n=1 Tax=Streptomyces sp. NPDC007164 TaxID=3156918 RepID=UPI003408DA33